MPFGACDGDYNNLDIKGIKIWIYLACNEIVLSMNTPLLVNVAASARIGVTPCPSYLKSNRQITYDMNTHAKWVIRR